ncbi:MAG: AEC family transporter [Chitinophagales bacterium]
MVLLFLAGYFLKFVKGVPKDLFQKINTFIIFLPLPAITLLNIPKLEFTSEIAFPILSAWLIFSVAIPFFYALKQVFNWSSKTFACLVLVCGLGNTSFIGFPIIEMMYGKENMLYAILVDQSSFVILSTVGVIWASSFGVGKIDLKQIFLRLIKFPPFIVFVVALFINEQALMPIHQLLSFLGSLMVPLAIFSIGMQFKFLVTDIDYKAFALGMTYKLILMPSLLFLLLFVLLKKQGLLYEITFIECAMPPMITASIIANKYKLDGQLGNALVTYGIPLSFITIWGWSILLSYF